MKTETYHFVKQNDGFYAFFSDGPKGAISKAVEYFKLKGLEPGTFNLSFGDFDRSNHFINDLSISNNSDRDKVLYTVAATIDDFMKNHPEAKVFAEGSTPSRTRLYQMGIAKALDNITENYIILGNINGNWNQFQRGINYNGFLLKNR